MAVGLRIGKIDQRTVKALSQVPEVKRQVRRVAAEVRKLARQKATKKTGTMARGIKVDNVYNGGFITHRVGWDKDTAWYGPLVELGTVKTPAQPHLRPAADEINNR